MKAKNVERLILIVLGLTLTPILLTCLNWLVFSDLFIEKGQEFRRGKGGTAEESAILYVADRYGTSIGNRDYRVITGKEGYEELSRSLKRELTNSDSLQKTVNFYKRNQLVTTKKSIKFTYLVIDGDRADISFTLKIVLQDAADKYLQDKKLDRGAIYDQHYQLELVKEQGDWKINKINETNL